jgi:hypothetical protein
LRTRRGRRSYEAGHDAYDECSPVHRSITLSCARA